MQLPKKTSPGKPSEGPGCTRWPPGNLGEEDVPTCCRKSLFLREPRDKKSKENLLLIIFHLISVTCDRPLSLATETMGPVEHLGLQGRAQRSMAQVSLEEHTESLTPLTRVRIACSVEIGTSAENQIAQPEDSP